MGFCQPMLLPEKSLIIATAIQMRSRENEGAERAM
jgi:hypothetical protein